MCDSRRSDHLCFFHQVCGSVSGAPARDAGEAGATPAHLTNCGRGQTSRVACLSSRRKRGQHPSAAPLFEVSPSSHGSWLTSSHTGVRVPPPRPLPGSSTVERPPVKRRDAGANPAVAANFVGETASDVTCPTCRPRSVRHRGRRPCPQPASEGLIWRRDQLARNQIPETGHLRSASTNFACAPFGERRA